MQGWHSNSELCPWMAVWIACVSTEFMVKGVVASLWACREVEPLGGKV